MNQEDAKRALKTIETLKNHSTYTDADAIAILYNLMQRSFADGKQYIRDQQENAIEMWRLVDGEGHVMPGDYESPDGAIKYGKQLQENTKGLDFSGYSPKLFREAMGNE